MQSRYHVPVIFDQLDRMATFTASPNIPVVQGYYARCDSPTILHTMLKDLTLHAHIIANLKLRAKLEIFVLELATPLVTSTHSSLTQRLSEKGWIIYEKQLSSSEDFSDQVSVSIGLIIGLNFNYVQTRILNALDHFSPTPVIPNSMSPHIIVEFDTSRYTLPRRGDIFTVQSCSAESSRTPSLEYIRCTTRTPQHHY
jgi:hypothetical protein